MYFTLIVLLNFIISLHIYTLCSNEFIFSEYLSQNKITSKQVKQFRRFQGRDRQQTILSGIDLSIQNNAYLNLSYHRLNILLDLNQYYHNPLTCPKNRLSRLSQMHNQRTCTDSDYSQSNYSYNGNLLLDQPVIPGDYLSAAGFIQIKELTSFQELVIIALDDLLVERLTLSEHSLTLVSLRGSVLVKEITNEGSIQIIANRGYLSPGLFANRTKLSNLRHIKYNKHVYLYLNHDQISD